LGQPNQSLTGEDLWGGHAYRRGIVHYLTRSGEQVNSIQSLLRHAPTSRAIVKYMGTAILHSDSTLAEKAARTSALQEQQEPPEISSLTTTTQCQPLPSTSQSSNNLDQLPHATIPPPTTHAFVVCARETPTRRKTTHAPTARWWNHILQLGLPRVNLGKCRAGHPKRR
jgi:hypothetical protein